MNAKERREAKAQSLWPHDNSPHAAKSQMAKDNEYRKNQRTAYILGAEDEASISHSLTKEEAEVVSRVLQSVDTDHLEFGLEFEEEQLELHDKAILKLGSKPEPTGLHTRLQAAEDRVAELIAIIWWAEKDGEFFLRAALRKNEND